GRHRRGQTPSSTLFLYPPLREVAAASGPVEPDPEAVAIADRRIGVSGPTGAAGKFIHLYEGAPLEFPASVRLPAFYPLTHDLVPALPLPFRGLGVVDGVRGEQVGDVTGIP